MTDQFIQVTTTTASAEQARQIAQLLVDQRLAACVQIVGPIESTYRWQDKIETASEWQCIAKTTLEQYAAIERAIREVHSYEVPEIIATPIVQGNKAYLHWLKDAIE